MINLCLTIYDFLYLNKMEDFLLLQYLITTFCHFATKTLNKNSYQMKQYINLNHLDFF